MRYFMVIFLFLSLAQTNVFAQNEEAKGMMEADEFVEEEIRGVKWLTDKFHMLGEIEQNEPVTVEYQFENVEDEPLVIIEVKSSCSCSVSEYTKTPIMKGEKGIIKATYDSKAEGEFFKTFMLLTNKSTTPNVLVISGNVVAN